MENKAYKIWSDPKCDKWFLKFDSDDFQIEITKEEFHDILRDMNFCQKAHCEGYEICYVPLAERIRTSYLKGERK